MSCCNETLRPSAQYDPFTPIMMTPLCSDLGKLVGRTMTRPPGTCRNFCELNWNHAALTFGKKINFKDNTVTKTKASRPNNMIFFPVIKSSR